MNIGADDILACWWLILGAYRAVWLSRVFDINPLVLFLLIPLLPCEWAFRLISFVDGDDDEDEDNIYIIKGDE